MSEFVQNPSSSNNNEPDQPGARSESYISYTSYSALSDQERNLLERLSTADRLQAEVFPPLQWVVPGLISEGYGLLVGSTKIGKSWFSLQLALAVASGGLMLGCIDTGEPRPVLYLALEDDPSSLQGRIKELLPEGEKWPSLLAYPNELIPGHEAIATALSWLKIHGHEKPLVIIDTLGRTLGDKRPGQSAFQFDYQNGVRLKTLADYSPGSTVLVIHHDRKMKSDDWMESISGTNGVNAAADYTILLTRARESDQGAISVNGRKFREGSYALNWLDPGWQLDGQNLEQAGENL